MIDEITLRNGPLEFSALSAGEGPLVLCLHGFPDCYHSFRHQLPVLADAGFRAVAVTLRGYETSSQPADGDYSVEALTSDVIAALDGLGEETAHIVGHDWGASIACTAAAAAPERFRSLTIMSVPHPGRFVLEAFKNPRQLRLSWYMFFFQLRGIADRRLAKDDFAFIRKLWGDWSPGFEPGEDVLADVLKTFREPGVPKAALAYYRAALSPRNLPLSAAKRAENRYAVEVPTLAITGRNDHCIDSGVFQSLMYEEDFPAGLSVKAIDDAGHFPHQEQPEAVNELLLSWFALHEHAKGSSR